MKLQHKLALTVFFFGFLTLSILALMIYFSDRNFVIKESIESLRENADLKANLVEQLMLDKTEVVITLASERRIVDSVRRSMLNHAALVKSERERLISRNDETWMASVEQSPFVQRYLRNPVADRLRELQNLFPGLYGELFVTDRYGALVGSTGKLTTYKHGHKYWWKGSFDEGKGKTYYDDRGFDESVQGYVVGIVVPVRDGTRVIGILKANINILSLLSSNLVSSRSEYDVLISLVRAGGEVVFRQGVEPLSIRIGEKLQNEIAATNASFGIIQETLPGEKFLTAYHRINIPVAGVKSPHMSSGQSIDHVLGNTNQPWFIIASRVYSGILSDSYGKLRILLILGFVITVVIGISAWPLAARMERIIEQRNTELQQALIATDNANRAKSVFLANMSHELRTPLNAILGYAHILQEDSSAGSGVLEKLSIIERSGNHLLTLINDILDLSKIEAEKIEITPAEVNILNFFDDIIKIFEMRSSQKEIQLNFERRISSSMESSMGFPHIVVIDEKRLRQVVFNLLSNAIKFTEKGYVTVRVTFFQESMLVDVEDSGRGISPDQIEAIFNPFHQVGKQKEEEGTGLGLPISRKLVELMGGQLRVESNPGLGSVFSFELPLKIVNYTTGSGINHRAKPSSRIVGYAGERKKVLIVDDLRANRMVLADYLKPLGFDISEASDGESALEVASSFRPHIIIMDMRMPNMDGFEATRRIRENSEFKDTIIFAFSASVFQDQRQNAINVGCNAFLTKPIDVDDLYSAFREYCGIRWIEKPLDKEPAVSLSVYPSSDELLEILNDIRSGDIKSARKRITTLRDRDPEFKPFCDRAEELLNHFKIKELSKFLEHASERGG